MFSSYIFFYIRLFKILHNIVHCNKVTICNLLYRKISCRFGSENLYILICIFIGFWITPSSFLKTKLVISGISFSFPVDYKNRTRKQQHHSRTNLSFSENFFIFFEFKIGVRKLKIIRWISIFRHSILILN